MNAMSGRRTVNPSDEAQKGGVEICHPHRDELRELRQGVAMKRIS